MTNKKPSDGQIAGQTTNIIFPDQWHRRPATPGAAHQTPATSAGQAPPISVAENVANTDAGHKSFPLNVTFSSEVNVTPAPNQPHPHFQVPAIPPAAPPLVPERSDFLEGDSPAADRVASFLTRALGASDGSDKLTAALVPWICDALLSNHSVKAPGVQKNATPSLTQREAIALLEAIPTDSVQGMRDLALMSVFFLTGCRVSAVIGACVGHLETDGVDHYLNVTEKRNKKRRKILLDAARPVLAYVELAGIRSDREGPLFRPMTPDGVGTAMQMWTELDYQAAPNQPLLEERVLAMQNRFLQGSLAYIVVQRRTGLTQEQCQLVPVPARIIHDSRAATNPNS